MDIKVYVKTIGYKDIPLPKYMTPGSAGLDLYACITESIKVEPGSTALVSTGLAFEIPKGYEAQIRPRSGLALKWGITLLNSPGTIDSDYRGEIKIIIINHGRETFIINRGDRIAQMVFCPVATASLEVVNELSRSNRGEGGFGHTGY
ncbi:MAG: dUTP diphosphatase [Clostridia bacterium]|nr:dUTP diphosphatase [Clostridia bacterium]